MHGVNVLETGSTPPVAILGISGVIHSPESGLICTVACADGSVKEIVIYCHETYAQAAQGLLEFVANSQVDPSSKTITNFKDHLH